MKKLLTLLSLIAIVWMLQACEQGSSSSGGGGSTQQVVDLTEDETTAEETTAASDSELVADAGSAETGVEPEATAALASSATPTAPSATTKSAPATRPDPAAADPKAETVAAAATAAVAQAEAEAAVRTEPKNEFHIIIDQTHMACADCGLNFDSAELVIDHSDGRFTARQSGSLGIKKGPYRQGRFRANISSIPPEAEIYKATLHMRLNSHDGVAGVDHSSAFTVKGYVDDGLVHIKDFNVQRDIKGRGYSKGLKPVVPFDYTNYARML